MISDETLRVCRGEEKADLILKNANIVNVFSGDIHQSDIAVHSGYIVGFGDYKGKEEISLKGLYVCPGFIDGHVHIESSMVSISEFARAVVPHGTTTVIIDPHEIANVFGLDGIKYMLNTSLDTILEVYLMLPSCVPATHLETSGAELKSQDLAFLINEKRVLGLAEIMNYPGVVFGDPEIIEKIRMFENKRIDGHAPGLSGKQLCAYITEGIRSDHECTSLKEAREKLQKGMYIMIREGSVAKNLETLLPLVSSENSRKCFFVTDDRHPNDLIEEGHIDFIVKKAIKFGIPPIKAIQMATINTAEYFGLKKLGVIAPGYQADFLVLDNLIDINVEMVFKKGMLVAQDKRVIPGKITPKQAKLRSSINVKWLEPDNFDLPARSSKVKVIEIIPDQLLTKKVISEIPVINGMACSDVENDILKIAVIERHLASGNIGLGFVRGFGLKSGAIASSVAHDSHNIIVVGTNDLDMFTAAVEIVKMRGGQALVKDGALICSLPLPIAGLMSDKPIEDVKQNIEELNKAAQKLGCTLKEPFMALSFLALPPIPEIKITDKGLVDAVKFEIIDLFED